MQLYTPVDIAPLPFRIAPGDTVLCLGSCFADEVGSRMRDADFAVDLNPFGTLYNPASVADALERIADDREIAEADLVEHDGLWHSWHHHGSFSRPTKQQCLDACNSRIHQAYRALNEAKLIVVTFGTAWVFEHQGEVVSNCHKLPPQAFVRRRMTVDEIVGLWTPLLGKIARPGRDIVFTVSPIRHKADGMHGNQISKATLLLAVEELCQLDMHTVYFPAYELVLDELRDYRFYGPDMMHPAPLAVDVVWDRFQQAAMTPAARQQAHNNTKQHLRELHRPIR